MTMYQLAPAGTPITLGDLASCFGGRRSPVRAADALSEAITRRYGVRHGFLLSTGRAAFALILQGLREQAEAGRDEVVLPSYTCYSAPASVARAGLKVRVCDVDPYTLDYDYAALECIDMSRVLCIASANLYGLPNDMPRLEALAARHGVFLLDDAAQCMEARIAGRPCGTFGDAGFFSLDKGKNITTIDGGVVVTSREDLGTRLAARVAALPPPSAATQARLLVKLLAYAGFLHPRLYWVPRALPFLGLGSTPYPAHLPIEGYPDFLAGLGLRLFERIGAVTDRRVANAQAAIALLRGVPGIRMVDAHPDASPVYLRLPLFVTDGDRDRAIGALESAGIGATGSFPSSIVDIPGIDPGLFRGSTDMPGGRWVARHIMTLPTHPYVDGARLELAARVLARSLS